MDFYNSFNYNLYIYIYIYMFLSYAIHKYQEK